MEVPSLCIKPLIVMMLLCEHEQKVVSLRIDPNRAQFFEYEPLTLNCEGALHCEVVHESTGKISSCNNTYKRTPPGTYTITNVYKEDSGKYWCDAGGETRNDSVNITVTDGPVILEISALPVMEGEDVTLRCRNKTTSSQTSAGFYKDGVFIISSSTGNMIIHSVSKSDEGLYKCSISGAGESAESRLTVRSKESPNKWLTVQKQTVTPPANDTPWIIVTILLAVLLVVVGLLHLVRGCWHKETVEPVMSASSISPSPLLTEDPFYSTIQEVSEK
ncbi:high affinity immunoglobulin gamma Fc receptor I-like [Anabas testudineus]|uniref:high affinity immunoglobulin gamma Fc receptor I-like n=1 Tax=Anabas testudineus TaxID=64144 RepID=UPI000E45CF0F|nr:high affinity immunoglobulin gamma Fc receptor I-like [Anabas testudineus]